MPDGLSGSRLGGVVVLLLVLTALATLLGFGVTIHWEEATRFHQYLHPPYDAKPETALRVRMEYGGAAIDAAMAGLIGFAVLLTLAKLNHPTFIRSAHRRLGWACFTFALVMLIGGYFVPRVGSPHNDMFPPVAYWASGIAAFLAGATAFGVSKLAKTEPRL